MNEGPGQAHLLSLPLPEAGMHNNNETHDMPKPDPTEQLCQLLNLSDDAISIAEGWSILPAHMQEHVRLLMSDYLASQIPVLQEPYSRASRPAQLWFNRIVEDAQRGRSGEADA